MHRIAEVRVLEDYTLRLRYSDGIEGVVDVSHLVGRGVFALWEDYEAFRSVRIGPSGELLWDDQVDLCPDSRYLRITGKQPEDLFPQLKRGWAYA